MSISRHSRNRRAESALPPKPDVESTLGPCLEMTLPSFAPASSKYVLSPYGMQSEQTAGRILARPAATKGYLIGGWRIE